MPETHRTIQVETAVSAPAERVWRALTEPEQIRQWFGWEHEGLADEIRFIFVDHAVPAPPDRIGLAGGQELQLASEGDRTVLRAVLPPSADAEPGWDAIVEGWRAFFEQLRFLLERAPAGRRSTVHLTGSATGAQVLAVLDAAGPTRRWHDSPRQRIVVDAEGRLLVVAAGAPLADGAASTVSLTVSAYGLDEAGLDLLHRDWAARWRAAVGT
ncbi:SRPBCC family protein [Micromonospora peucetia]|uniref:Activator of Hsp90 ATPase homolog 1-like protein n=1 Tax=Micromonospora peucetia TaxID=47871 RepID=A0A1C6UHS7_9ACTN|nr:SRPBCC domain-containing protein [Micromonospora peucetia]WSA34106.1 SRPBCC domain-containing protein [Micromonospora peucetia]SCL53645.1 Activator of Hsp90 ATPase homolog 1-like protein [Micromonospora peucetia]